MNTTAEMRSSKILFAVALEAEKRGLSAHSDKIFARAKDLSLESGLTDGRYAATLIEFADLCADCGRLEKAESLYREALSILLKSRGEEHPSTALAMRNLADICRKLGKESEAAELNSRAVFILAKQLEQTIDQSKCLAK